MTNLLCCCVFFLFFLLFFSFRVAVSQGWTPLHGVGSSGLLDLVDPLVERGAVIDAKTNVSMGPVVLVAPCTGTKPCHCSYLPPHFPPLNLVALISF